MFYYDNKMQIRTVSKQKVAVTLNQKGMFLQYFSTTRQGTSTNIQIQKTLLT